MKNPFVSKEIIKLLDNLIGGIEAIGESNADAWRLENLKILIDVTNWCLDNVRLARESGMGRPEASMHEIGWTAQCALDEWKVWLNELLNNY